MRLITILLVLLAAPSLALGGWGEGWNSGSGGFPGLTGSVGTNELIRYVDAGNVDRFTDYGNPTVEIYWDPDDAGAPHSGTAADPYQTFAQVTGDGSYGCGTIIYTDTGTVTVASDYSFSVGDCGGQGSLGVAVVARTRVGTTAVWYDATDDRVVFDSTAGTISDGTIIMGATTGPALYLGENLSVVADDDDAFDVKGNNRMVLLNPVCTNTATGQNDQCFTGHVAGTVMELWNASCDATAPCIESVQDGNLIVIGGDFDSDWAASSTNQGAIHIRGGMGYDILGADINASVPSGTIGCIAGIGGEFDTPTFQMSLSYVHDCLDGGASNGYSLLIGASGSEAPTFVFNFNTFGGTGPQDRGLKFFGASASASATMSGVGNVLGDDFLFPALWWISGYADNWAGGAGLLWDTDEGVDVIRVTPVAGGNNDFDSWTGGTTPFSGATGVAGAIYAAWDAVATPVDIGGQGVEADALTTGFCTHADCVAADTATHTLLTPTSTNVLGTAVRSFNLTRDRYGAK